MKLFTLIHGTLDSSKNDLLNIKKLSSGTKLLVVRAVGIGGAGGLQVPPIFKNHSSKRGLQPH